MPGRCPSTRPARRAMAAPVTAAIAVALLSSACGRQAPETRTPPYIVQEGCQFTLFASADNSSSTTVEAGNTMITMHLSMGPHRVSISDCRVVDNPAGLPLYRD